MTMPGQIGWDIPHIGDKVRIRAGPHTGTRGIIHALTGSDLLIELNNGEVIAKDASEVTNFSLAARRAWQRMPKRAGRPASKVGKKKLVSIRIEQDAWEQLGHAVELGLIRSREQAINAWIQDNLSQLLGNNSEQEVPNGKLES